MADAGKTGRLADNDSDNPGVFPLDSAEEIQSCS